MGTKPALLSLLALGIGLLATGCTSTNGTKPTSTFQGDGKQVTVTRNPNDPATKPTDFSSPPKNLTQPVGGQPTTGTTNTFGSGTGFQPTTGTPTSMAPVGNPSGSFNYNPTSPSVSRFSDSRTTDTMPITPPPPLQQMGRFSPADQDTHYVPGLPPRKDDLSIQQTSASDMQFGPASGAKSLPPINTTGTSPLPSTPPTSSGFTGGSSSFGPPPVGGPLPLAPLPPPVPPSTPLSR